MNECPVQTGYDDLIDEVELVEFVFFLFWEEKDMVVNVEESEKVVQPSKKI